MIQTADKAGVSTVGTSGAAGPSISPTPASDADVADVDPLLEESRSRASAPLTSRARLTSTISAGGYLAAAAAMLIGFDGAL